MWLGCRARFLPGHLTACAGNYEAAVEAMSSLKSKNLNDMRVQHNMLLAQYLADGCARFASCAWRANWAAADGATLTS